MSKVKNMGNNHLAGLEMLKNWHVEYVCTICITQESSEKDERGRLKLKYVKDKANILSSCHDTH